MNGRYIFRNVMYLQILDKCYEMFCKSNYDIYREINMLACTGKIEATDHLAT